jgi:hypothetical protein
MDRLEEHIRRNREDMDRYDVSESIWKGIKKKLKSKKFTDKKWLSIAAMFVVVIGTALLLLRPVSRWSESNRQSKNDDVDMQHNPQLKETELYYNNLVCSLYSEATPLLTNNPEIKKELNTDLSHLDSICTDIKKDLKDNISNQDVVEALIQNYRIKIRILEDMLTVLKENELKPVKIKRHEL